MCAKEKKQLTKNGSHIEMGEGGILRRGRRGLRGGNPSGIRRIRCNVKKSIV